MGRVKDFITILKEQMLHLYSIDVHSQTNAIKHGVLLLSDKKDIEHERLPFIKDNDGK